VRTTKKMQMASPAVSSGQHALRPLYEGISGSSNVR
jgi:hypothetical protein